MPRYNLSARTAKPGEETKKSSDLKGVVKREKKENNFKREMSQAMAEKSALDDDNFSSRILGAMTDAYLERKELERLALPINMESLLESGEYLVFNNEVLLNEWDCEAIAVEMEGPDSYQIFKCKNKPKDDPNANTVTFYFTFED